MKIREWFCNTERRLAELERRPLQVFGAAATRARSLGVRSHSVPPGLSWTIDHSTSNVWRDVPGAVSANYAHGAIYEAHSQLQHSSGGTTERSNSYHGLLVAAPPPPVTGEWDTSAVELTALSAPGYARYRHPYDPSNTWVRGWPTSSRDHFWSYLNSDITPTRWIGPNSSATDWPPITHIAHYALRTGDQPAAIYELENPWVVNPGDYFPVENARLNYQVAVA